MRRVVLPLSVLLAFLGGAAFAGVAAAAPANTYTLTRTFGPFNAAAPLGGPGSVPDGRALAVYCGDRESIVSGTAKINRKTSYGTTGGDVLTLEVIGAFYDTDRSDFSLGWGAFATPVAKKTGWNSVTITVTCHR